MKQPLFTKNVAIDERRISFIETIVSRLVRRSSKVVSAMVTPFPISSYIQAPVGNTVLKYMFPGAGKISRGLIHIEEMPKSGVAIATTLTDDAGSNSNVYIMKRNKFVIEPNIPVFSGQRLTVEIKKLAQEESISGIWVSLLWIPNISETDIKRCLIEDLDKLEESYASNEEEG